jgi:aspartate kinase
MAECGAKVVCAQAVEWARRAGIAVYARSTFDGASGARETIVRRFSPGTAPRARAVVCEGDVVLARVRGDRLRLDELLHAVSELDLAFKDLSISDGGGAFVIPLLNAPDWQGARRKLIAALPQVELVEAVSLVSVVGDGLAATAEPLARFVGVMRRASIEPRLAIAGPLRLGAVIDAVHVAAAQRALHEAFVEG